VTASTPLPVPDQTVDASGLTCPLPILRAKKALAQMASCQVLQVTTTDRHAMASCQVLQVTTTDRHAVRDFQAFANQTGNVLIAQIESEQLAQHYLRRR